MEEKGKKRKKVKEKKISKGIKEKLEKNNTAKKFRKE